ncbi:MAG: Gfo/Idh/MocA family oxidoreductase [Candidatus Rokubacteria bacterium]|nr:Gfo/Idh/MocA family oxidoreductase [Candidatus Rokubacteria bacterium]
MLQVGLIGCGEIGRLRAEALARIGSFRLVALSDLDAGRAAVVAAGHGAAVDRDWRALVGRATVDVVIVATPPSLHAEMCVEALLSGKHVLCEKPLARTPGECRRILEAQERSGRFLGTGFNYRFFPSIQKARALLDGGRIGELDHIRSYAGYSAADHRQPWLHDAEITGGGTLRDNGIHLIDLTRHFLGEVEEVKGFTSDRVWGFSGCEDNGFALLKSPTGRIAALQASWTEWKGYRFLVEIYGTRGCIRAWCFPMLTEVVWAREAWGRPRRRLHLFPMTHIGERLRSYRWVVTRSFIQELQALARAIRGEPTALATGRDGLQAVAIAHAISHSSASSQPTTVHAAGD